MEIFNGPHVSIVTLIEILDIVDDDDDDVEELLVYTCAALSDINKMADFAKQNGRLNETKWSN